MNCRKEIMLAPVAIWIVIVCVTQLQRAVSVMPSRWQTPIGQICHRYVGRHALGHSARHAVQVFQALFLDVDGRVVVEQGG